MNPLKRTLLAILQAIAGAWLFTVLFFVFVLPAVDFVLTGSPPHFGGLNWRTPVEILKTGAVGVAYMSWWILPVGGLFGYFAIPRVRLWPRTRAFGYGAKLGASLGLLTAVVFGIFATQTPKMVIRSAIVFLPVYCAIWCGLYARRVTKA